MELLNKVLICIGCSVGVVVGGFIALLVILAMVKLYFASPILAIGLSLLIILELGCI